MAIVQFLRDFFIAVEPAVEESAESAPETTYGVKPMSEKHLREVMQLNLRCFRKGENYSKQTFKYLLTDPAIISYRAVSKNGEMVGFIFVLANTETIAHVTTIGVAPEHRKRGVARMLLDHVEARLKEKGFGSLILEVRVSNLAAQNLYASAGYVVLQRLGSYYNNGEDAYLMSKAIV